MVRGVLFVSALCTPLLASITSIAAEPSYFDYHPMSNLTLGSGVDTRDLTATKSGCITSTITDVDNAGALAGDLSVNFVSTASNVRQAVHFDTKIDASYLAFSASASFNFDSSFERDENSISIVVYAHSDYSRRSVTGVSLTEGPKALLQEGNYAEFLDQCGAYYVSLERRGVMLSAIITIHNASETERTAIKAEMSAKGGFGPMSASARTSFSTEMAKANSENRLDVKVIFNGGPGLPALADLVSSSIKSKTSVDDIGASLATYIKRIDRQNAAPQGYFVTRYPGLPVDTIDLVFEQRATALHSIVDVYRALERRRNDLSSVIAGTDIRSSYFLPSQLAAFSARKPEIDDYLAKLAAVHAACKAVRKEMTEINIVCKLPDNQPTFAFLALPPPSNPPKLSFRIAAGPMHAVRLLNALDSSTVLKGYGDSDLLNRTKNVVSDATSSTLTVLIESYYIDGYRVYIEPSEELKKRYIDSIKEINVYSRSRLQLPQFEDSSSLGVANPNYFIPGSEIYLTSGDTPVFILDDYDPSAVLGKLEPVFEIYRELSFSPIVAGIAGQLKVKDGYVDIIVEARDIFDQRTRMQLFRLSWWDFNLDTYAGMLRVAHHSGLPEEIFGFDGFSPSEQ